MAAPPLNALRHFDAAARMLSFRAAAEALHVTQGAVAQQVRGLEAALGVRLFHRRARGLTLTEAGARYHTDIARALAIVDEATAGLRPQPARATISVTPSFAAKWLAPRLARFAEAHPEIDLRVEASEELTNFAADGVDLAVRQGPPPRDKGLQARRLAPLDLVIAAAPALAATTPSDPAPKDFADRQLIQDDHGRWDDVLAAAGLIAARRPMRFAQTALAIDMAREGQGFVIAPRLLLAADLENGALVALGAAPTAFGQGFYVIAPERRRPAPAATLVADWLMEEAAAETGFARGEKAKPLQN